MLPSFPLCLEWLDFPPVTSPSAQGTSTSPAKQFGNYIAVGTMEPEIEIWSLDVVEAMYPDMVLGRPDKTAAHVPTPLGTGKKKRKKTKHRAVSSAYHVDAVLSLSWNRTHRNLLASASADRTVKLWDLSRDPTISGEGDEGQGALRSFEVHKDKVQAVQWNEKEPTVLLTGSYDRTVRTFDSRAPDAGVGAVVGADVEAIRWDPWEAHGFYVGRWLRSFCLCILTVIVLGVAGEWPRAELRRKNAALRPELALTSALYALRTRWRCIRSRREPAHTGVPRHRRDGQDRQGLERQRGRRPREAAGQPRHLARSRCGTSSSFFSNYVKSCSFFCRARCSRRPGRRTTRLLSRPRGPKGSCRCGISVRTGVHERP